VNSDKTDITLVRKKEYDSSNIEKMFSDFNNDYHICVSNIIGGQEDLLSESSVEERKSILEKMIKDCRELFTDLTEEYTILSLYEEKLEELGEEDWVIGNQITE